MKKSLLCLLIGMVLAGLSSCIQDHLPKEDARQTIQSAVEKIRKNLSDTLGVSFPSLSLIIQTPTDKIFVSSRAEAAQLVTPDTYFRFGSETKNFTATAILNMWEDGWLDYKAKITDVIPGSTVSYVPATPDWDFPNKNEITIRQLMQHSAGVFDIDNDPNGLSYTETIQKSDPTHQFTTGELVQVLTQKKLSSFMPGKGYQYSNMGYSILAEIIKRVYSQKAGTAKTYADYMNDYVTGDNTPVPLPKIHFPFLASDIRMPDPHLISTLLWSTGPETFDTYNMSAQLGGGNGYGTMEELHKYIRTLMKGENGLKRATVQLMQQDVSAANPTYGLGCFSTPNLGYGHNGSMLGFLNLMAYDPDHDVSVVVMVPLADFRSLKLLLTCSNAMVEAAYAARVALGYPGKP